MTRRSKEVRQQEIGRVALRMIGMHGFHKLTTSALSQEVGLAEGTIFRHFRNKDEIILQASIELEGLLFQEEPSKEESNPLRRLRNFVLFRLNILRDYPEVRAIVFNEQLALTSTEEWRHRLGSILRNSLSFIRACLKEAQTKGMVAEDIPIDVLVWVVTGVVKGASLGAPHHIEAHSVSMTPQQVWTTLELLLRRTI